jgi:AraC-like DNA-binding protein
MVSEFPPIRIQQYDSPLGQWQCATWRPAELEGIVDRLWYFNGSVATPRERIFPDGCVELNVHLGAVYGQVTRGRTEAFPVCCASGLHLRPAVVEAPRGPVCVLGIRLLPGAAYSVLRHPLHELTSHTVDLGDLVGHASAELLEGCATATTAIDRLTAAARWVAGRVRDAARTDAAIASSASEILRLTGALSITTLRERSGWAKTRFTNGFKEQVGVTPKVLARIARFRFALDSLHRGVLPLGDLALRAGYYDQSHFNAEFREFSGLSPGDFLRAPRYPGGGTIPEVTR